MVAKSPEPKMPMVYGFKGVGSNELATNCYVLPMQRIHRSFTHSSTTGRQSEPVNPSRSKAESYGTSSSSPDPSCCLLITFCMSTQ
jgi:hypothetical protein